jgi:hypothetical protein
MGIPFGRGRHERAAPPRMRNHRVRRHRRVGDTCAAVERARLAFRQPEDERPLSSNVVFMPDTFSDSMTALDTDTGAVLRVQPLNAPPASPAAISGNSIYIGAGTTESARPSTRSAPSAASGVHHHALTADAGLPTSGCLRRAAYVGLPTSGCLRRAAYVGLPTSGRASRRRRCRARARVRVRRRPPAPGTARGR